MGLNQRESGKLKVYSNNEFDFLSKNILIEENNYSNNSSINEDTIEKINNLKKVFQEKKKKKDFIGEILLGKFFERKLFVKDSYVETTNDSSNLSIYFGFNLDVELDRDRKCVLSIFDRNSKICKIIGYILYNFEKIHSSLSEKERFLLDDFIEKVYYCLTNSYQITYDLYLEINKNGF